MNTEVETHPDEASKERKICAEMRSTGEDVWMALRETRVRLGSLPGNRTSRVGAMNPLAGPLPKVRPRAETSK